MGGDVWAGLLRGPISGYMALLQPWSIMSTALDTTDLGEDRAVQSWLRALTGCAKENWSCPSQAEALRRESATRQLCSG